MATSGTFNEHSAYSKLLFRLVFCGTKVLRKLLKDQVRQCGHSIDSFLASQKERLLNSFIGQINEGILFPSSNQQTNIRCWDICLLVHVLLTLCSSLPSTLVQNLTDLRIIRNAIAHNGEAAIDETQFNDLWTRTGNIIDDAMAAINDQTLVLEIEKDVKNIEKGVFHHDIAEYQKVIHQWSQWDAKFVKKLEEMQEGLYLLV